MLPCLGQAPFVNMSEQSKPITSQYFSGTLTTSECAIEISIVSIWDGEGVTTSLTIAEGGEQPHKAVLQLIRNHDSDLSEIGGGVQFSRLPFETAGGTQMREMAHLNEQQSSLLLTYMRNNEIVQSFKKRLIRAFYEKLQSPVSAVIDYEDPLFFSNLISQGAVRVMQLTDANAALEQKVALMEPKAVFHDTVVEAPDSISVSETAKFMGTGRNRLLAFMRRIRWVSRYNEPYQENIELGLLDVKVGSFKHPDHGLKQSVAPLVTGKGLAEIQKLWAQDQLT